MSLLSSKERKEYLENEGYQFISPTFESVKNWEEYTGGKFYNDIEFISSEKADEIITFLKPEGLFVLKDYDLDIYVGIDNMYREGYVEEFKDLETCVHWLNNKDYDYCAGRNLSEINKDGLER